MSGLVYTPLDEIPKIHQELQQAFRSGKTSSIAFRKEQIAQVGYMLKDHEQRWKDAAFADLGRPALETEMFDFSPVLNEVRLAYDNVEKWAKQQSAPFSLSWFVMSPKLKAEPKGVILIIAPFNFPLFLLLNPLVTAIAAGNAVLLKPSEMTPTMSALLAELMPQYLDNDLYRFVNGGVAETTKASQNTIRTILELQWDHILYIGNARVAKIVSMAAAKHLTPVTTELGGKNPVVIDPKCDIKTAARRILWGKTANCGQVCLAPDYVLVPKDFQDTFVDAMKEVYATFYPTGPANSDSFGRVVSEAHTNRIKHLLDETKGTVVLGGEVDVSKKYIAPTIVKDVTEDDALMSDEIFGPVLAVVPVKDVNEAIKIINSREEDHPLAVYVFSQDAAFKSQVFGHTQSGAALANDVIINAGAHGLPVGGVGPSGSGYYRGKQTFDQLTHLRVSMDNPSWPFPPYKPGGLKRASMALFPSLPPRPSANSAASKRWGFWFLMALVGAASVLLTKAGLRALGQLNL
ncbi:Aldehyde dehydrogenase, dimeric NADP-preferring [Grifola frondosa]|uniref:Aldehyde dehydrogenase n=1 Tax=Grifola frondosa TaxID=5627 RepID=A0A1C7M690_GRIFR|nr:Aldehyde dehydrogenase, dimeric NADP-preferring [Grifola frondosa]